MLRFTSYLPLCIAIFILVLAPTSVSGQATSFDIQQLEWIRSASDNPFGQASPGPSKVAAGSDGSVFVRGTFEQFLDLDGPWNTGLGGEVYQQNEQFEVNYLAKFDQAGKLVWVKSFESTDENIEDCVPHIRDIVVAQAPFPIGNEGVVMRDVIYLVGSSGCDMDFDGPSQTGVGGELSVDYIPGPDGNRLYLASYDTFGNFRWMRHDESELPRAMAMDIVVSKNSYFSGHTVYISGLGSTPIDLDGEGVEEGGDLDYNNHYGFIASYDESGGFESARFFTTKMYDLFLATSQSDGLRITGSFKSVNDPAPNVLDLDGPDSEGNGGELTGIVSAYQTGFVAAYDTGDNLQWAIRTGGTGDYWPTRIELDSDDNVYISGTFTEEIDLDADGPYGGILAPEDAGSGFLVRYHSYGGFNWVRTFIPWSTDANERSMIIPRSIAITDDDAIYMSGSLRGAVDLDGSNTGYGGELSSVDTAPSTLMMFMARFSESGEVMWSRYGTGSNWSAGDDLDVDRHGSIFVAGTYRNQLGMSDPPLGVMSYGPIGHYVVKYKDLLNNFFGEPAEPTIVLAEDLVPVVPNEDFVEYHVEELIEELFDSRGEPMEISEARIAYVTSDEPLVGEGDETEDDIIVESCELAILRQEMNPLGNGRVYTIHLTVTDQYGLTGSVPFRVHVGEDLEAGALDDGPVHEVEACMPEVEGAAAEGEYSQEIQGDDAENVALSVYPNPFNPRAVIQLNIPVSQEVSLSVYDTLGRQVSQLYKGVMEANQLHQVTFDAQELPSGVYIVRVKGETFVDSHRVILAK